MSHLDTDARVTKVEKVRAGKDWKTIFYRPSGAIAFHSDGTITIEGGVTREDIFAVFDIYKPPLRGMDWWRLFTIDHFNRVGGDYDANFVIDYFNLGNALPVIASNQRLMKWIKTKRLHTLICVDAFSGAKSALWDTKLDQPRRDSVAKDVLKYIQKHPGISRPDLRGYIKTLE